MILLNHLETPKENTNLQPDLFEFYIFAALNVLWLSIGCAVWNRYKGK